MSVKVTSVVCRDLRCMTSSQFLYQPDSRAKFMAHKPVRGGRMSGSRRWFFQINFWMNLWAVMLCFSCKKNSTLKAEIRWKCLSKQVHDFAATPGHSPFELVLANTPTVSYRDRSLTLTSLLCACLYTNPSVNPGRHVRFRDRVLPQSFNFRRQVYRVTFIFHPKKSALQLANNFW